MKQRIWPDVAARVATTAGALLPYFPALSLDRVYITDDGFASDIFNGELPIRVLVGQLVAAGQAPVWSSKLCSGVPLAGTAIEPISVGLFASLSASKALCLLIIVCVLIASQGAYALARRVGADRAGAALGGIAYGASGYLVTQLKHLSILSTVVWLPWGLFLLDRALSVAPAAASTVTAESCASDELWKRWRALALFGLVYAEQVLAGFPQSAYIVGLVYGVWALVEFASLRGRVGRTPILILLAPAFALAIVLAVASGAATLLPLAELGATSDRQGTLPWEFASMLPYSWSDALNFLVPYANGDVSDGTYTAPGFFWENYGYVGAATFLLAVFALIRGFRRPRVRLLLGIGIGAFLMVLGPNTPAYHLAWKYLPGMGSFRFPTRFLFVVDLALSMLAALGLTLLRPAMARLLSRGAPRIAPLLPATIVLGSALDLFANQSRQNPFVLASEWLARPAGVTRLGDNVGQARLFSPYHNLFHRLANRAARGWADLEPYRELRETVAPNTGVFWGVATADCYLGIAPTWFVDVWGDHSRPGRLIPTLMRLGTESIIANDRFAPILAAYGVTHVLSPIPIRGPQLRELEHVEPVHLYELAGKRARVLPNARIVLNNEQAATLMRQPSFEPTMEVLLHAPASTVVPAAVDPLGFHGEAKIVMDEARYVRLHVEAPRGGYLLLADNYYPGWRAFVDGRSTEILRANISLRGVHLPPGAETVEFRYDAAPYFRGMRITVAGVGLLLAWYFAASFVISRRLRRASRATAQMTA